MFTLIPIVNKMRTLNAGLLPFSAERVLPLVPVRWMILGLPGAEPMVVLRQYPL
jgi:hypothetical protein